jgi:heme/copper-type cytochrome/quinol oxidase subunit 3
VSDATITEPGDVAPPSTPDVEATPHGYDDGQDHIGLAHHTTTGLSNTKLAMWLFLGSECLLFGGLISTYMLYRNRQSDQIGPDQLWDIPRW